jgi:glyoxylase-like metal-dependent hydrolase (beta-lactamase superfamily II)
VTSPRGGATLAPGWPFGPYPPGGLRRLGQHVVAYHGDAYPAANSAIVRGAEATLVFDANTLRFARTLRAAVDKGGGPPLRELVLSHAHGDHAHGAMRFSPPARTWASVSAHDGLARWAGRDLAPFAKEMVAEQRLLGVDDPTTASEYREVRVVVPDRVVDARGATIELGGGVRVRLHLEATAHTPGDLWAFVEPDEIALCGDLWFNDCEPYIASGSLAGSLQALRHLRECGARIWLPGHGPAASMSSAGDDGMERYCRWIGDAARVGFTRGLRGADLRTDVRRAWSTQREGPRAIRFALEIPGFLEDNVEMLEEQLSGEPALP